MPDWRQILLLLLLIAAIAPGISHARSISVDHVSARIAKNRLVLNAKFDIHLNESAIEALDNGVALEFELESRLLLARPFWWDATVATTMRTYRLTRHALADRYTLRLVGTDKSQTFKSLNEAQDALGTLQNFIGGEIGPDAIEQGLHGKLRLRLNIEALPAPMRPIAYVSPGWRMSSGWVDWTLAQ